MSLLKEIESRRSVRRYRDLPVSREQVMEILEAGRLSLSGSNTQPWRFMVITDPQKKSAVVKADNDQEWMLQAPVFIACLADLKSRQHEAPVPENTLETIAVSFMILQAEHMGLATCWTGWYDQREMRKALGINDEYYVSGILTVGYGAESPDPRPRLSMEEILLSDDLSAERK